MSMPGFTADSSLDLGGRHYHATETVGRTLENNVLPAALFRYCEGWPPVCCTCDLTEGGCDCSWRHDQF
jgi:hypothetical protein